MEDVSTLREYLQNAVLDILCYPMDLSAVMKNLKACGNENTELAVLGISNATKPLKETLEPLSLQQFPDSNSRADKHKSGSFAIIGMGGRFPGGDDLDSFWNVLEEGLDLHQPVQKPPFWYFTAFIQSC